MRRVLMVVLMLLAMTGSAMAAGDGRNFGVLAPPDWTPGLPNDAPTVVVTSFLTESGVEVVGSRVTEVMPANALRDVDASQFVGSNKEVCVNATAQHQGFPETEVVAVPLCFTFQLGTLVPPTLQFPGKAP